MIDPKTKQVNWPRAAVVYQIYPRSFRDTSNNGIGDLEGIIEKLDYLNDGTEESLGIDAIWLTPIYKSPMVDFGYDVSDYYDIDPLFGDLKVFDKLVEEAHRRNIKIIMDFVPNHTSSQHPWFIESRSSRDNPKRDWYVWRKPKSDGSPPNNWLSVFGGSAWTYNKKTNQFYLHSFAKEQPDLNWHNFEVKDAIKQAMRFWLKKGVDGIRMDAVYWLAKDRKFQDDPPNPNYQEGVTDPYEGLLHTRSRNQQEMFDFLNELGAVIADYPERFMMTEAYPEKRIDVGEYMRFYKNYNNKIAAPFNFEMIYLPWKADAYKRFIDDFQAALRLGDLPIYVLGNHDRSRVASRLGTQQACVAAMMLLSLPGLLFIYYGEELGMKDTAVPQDKVRDPWGKGSPSFNFGREPVRTPMQWNSQKYAGFSEVDPWLPVANDYKEINVENESVDSRSILNLYRKLIHYRKNSPALLKGDYLPLDINNKQIFAFIRGHKSEKILVLLNFSKEEQKVISNFKKAKVVYNTQLDKEFGSEIDMKNLSFHPHEGYILNIS